MNLSKHKGGKACALEKETWFQIATPDTDKAI